MRILVTGSSGFIATHLVRALIRRGHLVHGMDTRRHGNWADQPMFAPHTMDVTCISLLEELFRQHRFDAILHLAAGVGPEHVVADPYGTVAVNVQGTQNVLNLARRYSPQARILFTSTSEVYGNCPDRPFNEDTSSLVLGPSQERRWCYAASKISAEHLVLAQGGCVVRLFNTTGPGQSEEYVVPKFVGLALRGEDITLYGDGSQVRCFCHVADTVAALVALLNLMCQAPTGKHNDIFNIGSDTETTIAELALQVQEYVNSEIEVQIVAEPPEGSLTMPYRKPDLRKIAGATGWFPQTPLETIIKDITAWKVSGGKP